MVKHKAAKPKEEGCQIMVRRTMPSWLTLCGAPTLLTAKRPPCASAPGAIYHLQPKTALSRFPPVHKTNLERQQRVRFDPFATRSVYDRYLRILAIASRSPKGRNPPKADSLIEFSP
jgi:hypothetical protein